MESYKFDAIIFGNGMTLNLFEQLKEHVPNEKLYLFNIDEFLKRLISNKLPFKEEQYIEKIFYKKKSIENTRYFSELKDVLRQYYLKNNANIEKILGRDLFKAEGDVGYNIGAIKGIFPALYNIWFNVLYKYIMESNLEKYIGSFYNCVKLLLCHDNDIYTTNFDLLSDKYMNTKHIHGRFLEQFSHYYDVKLCMKSKGEFNYKFIWGYNGLGKAETLYEFHKNKSYDKYFDTSILFEEIAINNLLIYGLSFQRAGYINDDFLGVFPKYKDDNFEGTVIDEHLLWRIAALQNLNKLKTVTVSYYSEKEKDYFMTIFEYYKIKNVRFVQAQQFDFKIE